MVNCEEWEEKIPYELKKHLPVIETDASRMELVFNARQTSKKEENLSRSAPSQSGDGQIQVPLQHSRSSNEVRAKNCCYSVGFFASGAIVATGLGVGGAAAIGLIALSTPALIGLVAGSLLMALLLFVLRILECRNARHGKSLDQQRKLQENYCLENH